MRVLLVLALLSLASPAWARPGFYIGLGGGSTGVSGERVGPDRVEMEDGIDPDPYMEVVRPTTELGSGASGMFRLGFNILGYAAIEAITSGSGSNLADGDERNWAAHAHLGLRAYPLWHWQARLPEPLQPLEPSLFLGWGTSYQAYTPSSVIDPVGFSKTGTMRLGLGLEYFVISYFKVALDYHYIRAPYDNFIYNFEESINFPVSPAVVTSFHQVLASIAFQFGPAQETVQYAAPPAEAEAAPVESRPAPAREPEPAPALAPAPEPVIDG